MKYHEYSVKVSSKFVNGLGGTGTCTFSVGVVEITGE
jgi:hypothetical protein